MTLVKKYKSHTNNPEISEELCPKVVSSCGNRTHPHPQMQDAHNVTRVRFLVLFSRRGQASRVPTQENITKSSRGLHALVHMSYILALVKSVRVNILVRAQQSSKNATQIIRWKLRRILVDWATIMGIMARGVGMKIWKL